MSSKKPLVLCLYNNKGGVTKSTTTQMLAQYYAYVGMKVLVIDADTSENTTNYFFMKEGGERKEFKRTLKDILDPYDPFNNLAATIRKSERIDNLFVVPSDEALEMSDYDLYADKRIEEFVNKMTNKYGVEFPKMALYDTHVKTKYQKSPDKSRMDILKQAIEKYTELPETKNHPKFDIILIDTHPSKRTMINYNVLCASDYILIPCDKDVDTVNGIASILSVIKEVQQYNPKLKVGGIIYTKFNSWSVDGKSFSELKLALEHCSEVRLYSQMIPFDNKQNDLRWTRRRVFKEKIAKSATSLADCYQNLAEEILYRIGWSK